MRYVNSEIITLGDVILRNQIRLTDFERRARVLPRTPDEVLAFSRQSLEEVTDDALLAQRAAELGATPDHDEIALEVLENARRSGQGLTLRDQAEQRRILERRYSIDRVIGYYEMNMPQPTPRELEAFYQAQITAFDRPARARVYQILLRPSSADEKAQIATARQSLLRNAQDVADPALQALVGQYLTRYLGANPAGQDQILGALLADLAKSSSTVPADAAILDRARALQARAAALRDRAEVGSRLEAIRLDLAGRFGPNLITAFKAAAKAASQGPGAERGGDQGWIEPGTFSPALEAQVFGPLGAGLPAGTLSPVFWAGDVATLLLVADSEPARRRPFAEVSGELERFLRLERREKVRRQTLAILRSRATIRDVEPLERLAQ